MMLARRLLSAVASRVADLWTPAAITTALWLDAADSSTITLNGSTVSEWRDKSGNNRHISQITAAKQPTLTASNSIWFNGAHWMKNDTAQMPLNAFCFGVVFRETTSVANAGLLSIKGSSYDYYSADGLIFGPANKTNTRIACTGSASASFQVDDRTSHTSANPLAVYVVENSALLGSFYINGSNVSTDSSFTAFSSASLGGFVIGARLMLESTPTSPYLAGEVMEIVYTVSADRQKIEGYLAHKWGLTDNLPSVHPYKTAAPTV